MARQVKRGGLSQGLLEYQFMMKLRRLLGARKQSGYVLVTVAILLVVLLGFMSLGVDVGILYADRTQSQRAADAAALSGAFTYVIENLTPGAAQVRAEHDATQVAIANKVMGQSISAAGGNCAVGSEVCSVADVANRRVTVTITRNEPTFFGKILGSNNVKTTVRAVAEAAPNPTSYKCAKPWFIPNTIAAINPPEKPCDACNSQHFLLDPATRLPTPFATAFIQSSFNLAGFNVRSKDNDKSLDGSGDTYQVQLTNNSGADVRAAIGGCADFNLVCRNTYYPLQGVKQGPITQGIGDLVGGNGSIATATWQFQNLGQYYNRITGNTSNLSSQLILAPIVDLCSVSGFCNVTSPGPPILYANTLPNGSGLGVLGFALLFIDGLDGNDVRVHLINVTACSGTSPDPASGSEVFATPLRLVRVP